MRVVLDTNVVVSAALTPHGACARILDLLLTGAFELCADDRILDEYDAVLRRPQFEFTAQDVDALMDLLRHTALSVVPPPVAVEVPDPDDLPFLEVAAAADAILVTGNLRHFPKKASEGVSVLRPGDFLRTLRV